MSITNRLKECTVRIGNMCCDHRPPRMSIPVREDDDDTFITTTCLQAAKEIDELRTALQENAKEIEHLTVALNRYSADEIRLTKESTIAAQQEQIERLTAEDKDFQILYEAQSVIIHTLTVERDAMCKKVWQDAAQLCHEMYMAQEYQAKIGYCPDDYADGIAEGMARCAKELAKKAKEQQ